MIAGRAPLGMCPRCGEGRALDAGRGRLRCRNCERVWTPEFATDGGSGPAPTEVSVHPEECKRMRRISDRGPSVEEIAGLFDRSVGIVEYHLSAECGCPDNERPAVVRGGGR